MTSVSFETRSTRFRPDLFVLVQTHARAIKSSDFRPYIVIYTSSKVIRRRISESLDIYTSRKRNIGMLYHLLMSPSLEWRQLETLGKHYSGGNEEDIVLVLLGSIAFDIRYS